MSNRLPNRYFPENCRWVPLKNRNQTLFHVVWSVPAKVFLTVTFSIWSILTDQDLFLIGLWARLIVHGFCSVFFFFYLNSTFYQSVVCVGNSANEKNLSENNSIYFLLFYLFIGVSFSRWNFLLLLSLKTIKNSSGQMRQLYAYVAHESTLNHKLNRILSFPPSLKYF